jgi:hypothetical protein
LPSAAAAEVAERLGRLIGIRMRPVASMLAITLGNVGQIVHPGIMYGLFRDREDVAFAEEEIPLFYQGVTEAVAGVLDCISDEIGLVAGALSLKAGWTGDDCRVGSLREWLIESYGDAIADPRDTRSCLATNSAYAGLRIPIVKSGALHRPDFRSRYLTEDVPYGLVVTKGIADICGVATPTIDEVLATCSRWMGAEYYVDSRPVGRDIKNSRHPVNFGIATAEQLVRAGS